MKAIIKSLVAFAFIAGLSYSNQAVAAPKDSRCTFALGQSYYLSSDRCVADVSENGNFKITNVGGSSLTERVKSVSVRNGQMLITLANGEVKSNAAVRYFDDGVVGICWTNSNEYIIACYDSYLVNQPRD